MNGNDTFGRLFRAAGGTATGRLAGGLVREIQSLLQPLLIWLAGRMPGGELRGDALLLSIVLMVAGRSWRSRSAFASRLMLAALVASFTVPAFGTIPTASADGAITLLRDIYNSTQLGGGYSNPEFTTKVGSTIYFRADDGLHGREIWKTDGTGAGTVLVKDI